MYQDSRAELVMTDIIGGNTEKNENHFDCTVFMYDEKNESIYLILEECDLSEISLDADYKCTIETEGEEESCTGRIRERFVGKNGNVAVLQIENGFYKISIN